MRLGCARVKPYSRRIASASCKLKPSASWNHRSSNVNRSSSRLRGARVARLKLQRSSIHTWGVFALAPICANEFVIDYVGEKIRSIVADAREANYTAQGIDSSYFFRLDENRVIDATKCGNMARYVNHSCDVSSARLHFSSQSPEHSTIHSRIAAQESSISKFNSSHDERLLQTKKSRSITDLRASVRRFLVLVAPQSVVEP